MDGLYWMNGLMDGWMDGWIHGWMDVCMYVWMDDLTGGLMDEWTDQSICGANVRAKGHTVQAWDQVA